MTAVSSASVPEHVKNDFWRRPGVMRASVSAGWRSEGGGEWGDRGRGVGGRDVAEPVHLRLDGRVDLVVRVPDGDRQDAAEEVEIRLPIRVLDVHPLAGLEDDGLLVVVRDGGEEELLVLRAEVSGRKSLCFGNRAHVRAFLLRKLPLPALPTNVPFSMITSPREMTVSAAPWTTRPSYGV